MENDSVVLLHDDSEFSIDGFTESKELYVDLEQFEEATGWHLDDRGLCKDERCIPVGNADSITKDNAIRLRQFSELVGCAYASNLDPSVAAIGPEYDQYTSMIESTDAPDFSLPNLEGDQISLSNFEGNKIFLLVWASW
jgi:hypothetical protein